MLDYLVIFILILVIIYVVKNLPPSDGMWP